MGFGRPSYSKEQQRFACVYCRYQISPVGRVSVELPLEQHPPRNIDRQRNRPFHRLSGYHRFFGIFGYRPEKRELGNLLIDSHHRRAGKRLGLWLVDRVQSVSSLIKPDTCVNSSGIGPGSSKLWLRAAPFARKALNGISINAIHAPFLLTPTPNSRSGVHLQKSLPLHIGTTPLSEISCDPAMRQDAPAVIVPPFQPPTG